MIYDYLLSIIYDLEQILNTIFVVLHKKLSETLDTFKMLDTSMRELLALFSCKFVIY